MNQKKVNKFLTPLHKSLIVDYLSLMMFKDTLKGIAKKREVNDRFIARLNEIYKLYSEHYEEFKKETIDPNLRPFVMMLEYNNSLKPTAKSKEFWKVIVPLWWNEGNPFKYLHAKELDKSKDTQGD
jgi:hypothetical protein